MDPKNTHFFSIYTPKKKYILEQNIKKALHLVLATNFCELLQKFHGDILKTVGGDRNLGKQFMSNLHSEINAFEHF